ncbi:MAG: SH3 domain-containing protein [Candidatus Riflebacteria bacterium]|nr:SH3 domain-containing protein [Candidatus Riflebacteria bacterium]
MERRIWLRTLCLLVMLGMVMAGTPARSESLRATLDSHDPSGDSVADEDIVANSPQNTDPSGSGKGGETTGTVVVDPYLNVRDGPWGNIIGALHDGNQVQIVDREGDWYKIRWNGGYAWVHSDYVRTGSTSAPATQKGVVHVDPSLNIRASPWGEIVGSFYEGDQVDIIGREGDWYKISWNGRTVYCHSQYITAGGSSTPAAPSAPSTPSTPTTGANGKIVLPVPEQLQMRVPCPAPSSACGPTSLAMAISYFTKQETSSLAARLWDICGSTAAAGTAHAGLKKGAAACGFPNAQWHYSVDLSWVRSQIKAGKPVIANVYNHYVVIKGVDDSGNIYYNDPWGGGVVNHVKSYDEFSSWWNGGGCWHAAMTLN